MIESINGLLALVWITSGVLWTESHGLLLRLENNHSTDLQSCCYHRKADAAGYSQEQQQLA